MTAKKILYIVGASAALGAIIGMLYAPDRGAETRQKIKRLKRKFGIGADDEPEDYDRETLEEVKFNLQKQLKKIDMALEKEAG